MVEPGKSRMGWLFISIYLCSVHLIGTALSQGDKDCTVPDHFRGHFYSIDGGKEREVTFKTLGFDSKGFDLAEAKCRTIDIHQDTEDAEGNFDARIVFYGEADVNCYLCLDIYYRTPNILQIKKGQCVTQESNACNDIKPNTDVMTLFKMTMVTVNCKTIFEGTFHFSYEVNFGGGGVCDSERSYIKACQEPGSPYVDNQVFQMVFARCPGVQSSQNKKIRFQCMGSWRNENGNIFAAIADLGEDIPRMRYKCLMTADNQQQRDNQKRYTMSRWASCDSLKSTYDGPIRLNLRPSIIYGTKIVEAECNLPRNFTGTWFTTGEFDTDVVVNATHIYFKTKLDEFTYKEQLFTCQVNRDSRYLMSVVTVGKCEVDYVCFDFMPRHHNIIRWRMGRPFRLEEEELSQPGYLHRKFRQSCTWSTFTYNREEVSWKYQTFLLNPPAPVDCPIGGRYQFVQIGAEAERYTTRIRGITQRPRHMIDCREWITELKSCSNNPKKIFVDAEYCETVDHTGRPIGEYDIADRELNCVGYWMEDMRSYMITYDEEDAVSPFRCWVYERLDWRDMIVSRATRASCGETQTATSYKPSDGASLHLVLKENEREWDECPQRYDTGADPYDKELKIYVLSNAPGHLVSLGLVVMAIIIQAFHRLS